MLNKYFLDEQITSVWANECIFSHVHSWVHHQVEDSSSQTFLQLWLVLLDIFYTDGSFKMIQMHCTYYATANLAGGTASDGDQL